ncbi:MAG: transglycosylase domain-containing protein [Dethiobacteraceae bacterium]
MIKRIIALLCILLIVGVGFNYYVLETTDERFDLTKDLPQQVAAEIPDYVIYADLPPELIKAVLAVEDQRFFSHSGVDFIALGRAMLVNLSRGRLVQGGSTITQQLAKNLFLSQQQTLSRKVKEFFLTFALERNYSKEEILEMYLNYSYFGAGAYGAAAASQRFFAKELDQLTVEECAMLAGVLKGPSIYNPVEYPEQAAARQTIVLKLMEEKGYLAQPN